MQQKENPKYRTVDSPKFVEPEVVWPPSMTDPSQAISVDRLVAIHVRSGKVAEKYYGVDLSKLGFAELTELEAKLSSELEKKQLGEKEAKDKAAAQLRERQASVKARLLQQLKAGSPELQALAAELTGVLPGFDAPSAGDEGAGS